MRKNFKAGDKVFILGDAFAKGEVVSFDGDYDVQVKLENDPKVYSYEPYEVVPESLAESYETIAANLKQAGELISKAADLADKNGDELREMYDLVRPLYKALDNAGWSSSSMRC